MCEAKLRCPRRDILKPISLTHLPYPIEPRNMKCSSHHRRYTNALTLIPQHIHARIECSIDYSIFIKVNIHMVEVQTSIETHMNGDSGKNTNTSKPLIEMLTNCSSLYLSWDSHCFRRKSASQIKLKGHMFPRMLSAYPKGSKSPKVVIWIFGADSYPDPGKCKVIEHQILVTYNTKPAVAKRRAFLRKTIIVFPRIGQKWRLRCLLVLVFLVSDVLYI